MVNRVQEAVGETWDALKDLCLGVGELGGEQCLSTLAVRAVGLGEDGDDVVGNRGLVENTAEVSWLVDAQIDSGRDDAPRRSLGRT